MKYPFSTFAVRFNFSIISLALLDPISSLPGAYAATEIRCKRSAEAVMIFQRMMLIPEKMLRFRKNTKIKVYNNRTLDGVITGVRKGAELKRGVKSPQDISKYKPRFSLSSGEPGEVGSGLFVLRICKRIYPIGIFLSSGEVAKEAANRAGVQRRKPR